MGHVRRRAYADSYLTNQQTSELMIPDDLAECRTQCL